MKRRDGAILKIKDEVKDVWKQHFELLMNESIEGRAKITSMGVQIGGWCPHTQLTRTMSFST